MAAQLPYTHDDWDWGLSYGMEQLLHATINSRYVGNFFVVIMTRSPIAKTIIMGFSYFLIPSLLSLVALHNKDATHCTYFFSFSVASILIFAMPENMWAQTYGWVSGFANYVLSAVFIFFWIAQINHVFDPELHFSTQDKSVSVLIMYFFISIMGQLFIENLALYNVFLALILCLVYRMRGEKIPTVNYVILAGAIIGLFIMFSSGLYRELLNDVRATDGMRRLIWSAGANSGALLYYFLLQFLLLVQGLYENNTFLCIFVLVVLSCLLFHAWRENDRKISLFYFFANIVYLTYFVCVRNGNPIDDNYAIYSYLIVIAINISYYFIVLLELIHLYVDNKLFLCKLLFLWSSAPILIAPLIITLDSGARLFFTSNIFIYLFSIILLLELYEKFSFSSKSMVFIVTVSASIVLLYSYFSKYNEIGQCKRERESIIFQALSEGSSTILLPDYPHDELLWVSRPYDYKRLMFFKEFYGIPEETEIVFVENKG